MLRRVNTSLASLAAGAVLTRPPRARDPAFVGATGAGGVTSLGAESGRLAHPLQERRATVQFQPLRRVSRETAGAANVSSANGQFEARSEMNRYRVLDVEHATWLSVTRLG